MTVTEPTPATGPATPPSAGPPPKPRHHPVLIAPDTWVIQDTQGEGVAPVTVHVNSMVIRGAEPVVVDTGVPTNEDRYLEDLFSIVEPEDVRWVFLSHDDVDHHGNVLAVMEACPNATLVASWFLCERLGGSEFAVPPTRWRWLGDGEGLDAGDRTLLALRPPLYDSPTTRGLFDPTTGVYWASDAYATPVASGTEFVDQLDEAQWTEGFTAFQAWNSPWASMLDPTAFRAECRRIEELPLRAIATCHGPTVAASHVARAHELMRSMAGVSGPPQPDQAVLEGIIAGMTAAGAA